jgi:beta-lactam-binding protein with PASTA domain
VERVYDDEVVEGIVIGTDPAEQSQVLNSSEVAVLVSLGPRMEEVPEVVGNSEEDAIAILEAAGFTVGDISYVYSDTIEEGQVTATTPSAGETVRHDAAVTLIVSGGPEPIKIPNVVGNSEETAIGILEVYALNVTVIHERTNEDVEKGRVFRQDPAGDADGFRTQDVTIYVSDGPPLITVPDYTDVPGDEATRRAEELGLKVERAHIPGRPKDATVVGQQPAPGTEVEEGSKLVLYY